MRYQLVDRILSYELGKTITGSKQISVDTDNRVPFAPDRLFYPTTLVIEALAQLGGLFVSASFNFELTAVLGMVSRVDINGIIKIGSELKITARVRETSRDMAVIDGQIGINGEPILSAERIVFGLLKLKDKKMQRQLGNLFKALNESRIGRYPG
ncbi:MAG: hypothetical protein GY850_41900 [bacterium]|nr:hypothetical protein [bacterium]